MNDSTDTEQFERCRADLCSAVIGDIMDRAGYTHQFLPPQIQPLHHG